MSDDYVTVEGRAVEIRKMSVLFAVGKSVPRGAWVPRSCIHGADDIKLDGLMAGSAITLRIREWKADECGFTSGKDRDGADRDLFQRGEQ